MCESSRDFPGDGGVTAEGSVSSGEEEGEDGGELVLGGGNGGDSERCGEEEEGDESP